MNKQYKHMIEKNQIIYLLSHQNLMNIYGLNLTLYESFFVIAQSFFLLKFVKFWWNIILY